MSFRTTILAAASAAALMAGFSSAALAGVIEGRVSDQTGAISIEGAVVRVRETGQTVSTDRAGEFRLANVSTGEYTLVISYLGADPVEVTVNVPNQAAIVRSDVAIGEDVPLVDNILVIGQRGSLNSALNQERSADNIRTVLSADAIGQFPDENVAEAARRAPGVNVFNDQGEGRFVSIRGLDPNLNSTSINGVRIPSPDGDDRSVALDVIDSDVLSAIVITKSLTPDLDGDTIGGNIEIQTLSGLEQDDLFLKLKGAGTYANITEDFGQKFSGTVADKFLNDTLGVAASISFRERNFGSDNKEVDDGEWTTDEDGIFPNELEFRDYEIERRRLSATLNLDYRPNDTMEVYLHSLFSDFRDQEFRSRVETKYGDGEFARADGNVSFVRGVPDDPGTPDEDETVEFEVDRDIKDREETQQIFSIVGGGAFYEGPWTIDWSVAYSHSEEEEPDRIDAAFRGKFDDGEFGVDVSDVTLPAIAFDDGASFTNYFDTDNYEFDELVFLNGKTQDEEVAFTADFTRDMDIFGSPGFVKAGGKVRLRDKDRDVNADVYDGFDGDDLFLTQFATPIEDYRLDTFGDAPSPGLIRDFFNANRDNFELNDFDTGIENFAGDYVAQEDIYAGYLMAKVDIDRLRVVGGVRVEHTQFDATGNAIIEQAYEDTVAGDRTADAASLVPDAALAGAELIAEEIDAEFNAGDNETEIEAARLFRIDQVGEQSYTDWLPSVNARYEFADNVIGRLGYYKSIVRPNISAVVPAAEIAQENDELEAGLGNPDLERQRAHNIDASIAWYPNRSGVISIGAFYKRINDFIALANFENFTFNGVTYDEASINVNLEESDLYGLEINVQQSLTQLPAPFDGLIVGANYTFVDSEATLADGREIELPRQSQNVGNIIIGYDKGRFDLRAVGTYRDEYIDELNFAGDGIDRIVDDHFQIDLSGKFRITDQFRAYVEAKNITNEPFYAFVNDGGFSGLNSQFEEYGYSLEFGLTFTY